MVQKERSLSTAFSRSRGPPAFSQIVNEDENLSLKMSNASDTTPPFCDYSDRLHQVHQHLHSEVLTPALSECDFIWK